VGGGGRRGEEAGEETREDAWEGGMEVDTHMCSASP